MMVNSVTWTQTGGQDLGELISKSCLLPFLEGPPSRSREDGEGIDALAWISISVDFDYHES